MAKTKQDFTDTDEVQTDYVVEGSPEHVAMLGLREATKDDMPQWKGYALTDLTAWGPGASDKFLLEILKQKIAELTAPHVPIQSDDPRKPGYAPPMFVPTVGGQPRRTRGIV